MPDHKQVIFWKPESNYPLWKLSEFVGEIVTELFVNQKVRSFNVDIGHDHVAICGLQKDLDISAVIMKKKGYNPEENLLKSLNLD